jgi:hypothetical protein
MYRKSNKNIDSRKEAQQVLQQASWSGPAQVSHPLQPWLEKLVPYIPANIYDRLGL